LAVTMKSATVIGTLKAEDALAITDLHQYYAAGYVYFILRSEIHTDFAKAEEALAPLKEAFLAHRAELKAMRKRIEEEDR